MLVTRCKIFEAHKRCNLANKNNHGRKIDDDAIFPASHVNDASRFSRKSVVSQCAGTYACMAVIVNVDGY